MTQLTTTSYAILSLLAVHEHSTYELAQQMQRTLSWFWPRAESVLYEEPKRLVAAGLATSEQRPTGRRRRTIYTITDDGRRALKAWMAVPPTQGMSIESEAMVKAAFADHGTKADAQRTIAAIRADAEERLAEIDAREVEYDTTGGPYPERLHVVGVVAQYLRRQYTAVVEWADWAEGEVGNWSSAKKG